MSAILTAPGAPRPLRLDVSSNGLTGIPSPTDQLIGVGDGLSADFQLAKTYGEGEDPQRRPITRPRPGTVSVALDGAKVAGWLLRPGGMITFDAAPPEGAAITAGFEFDVPVRFAEDRLDISGANFAAGEAPSVPLVEIREAV